MPKPISVGTLESSDCLITIKPHHETKIEIDTIVHEAFFDHIKKRIEASLQKHDLKNIHIICQDKGALDYTIQARLKTAIARYKENKHG